MSVPPQRVLIWIVSTEGDAAEGVEEMYGATERRLVFSIIKGAITSRSTSHHETSLFGNDTKQRTYSELKRSHELFQ
ncbi:hypothetical protein XI08_38180 [Bradyrhizobium sp. CCBAU 11361]|nr:hypothetical protein [Bradyrhizobium sp. CCBAU 11361]